MAENNKNSSKLDDNFNGNSKNDKKENLLDFTKQLVSLGALQQAIVRNLQKEIENL
jgi:hypothetical protein